MLQQRLHDTINKEKKIERKRSGKVKIAMRVAVTSNLKLRRLRFCSRSKNNIMQREATNRSISVFIRNENREKKLLQTEQQRVSEQASEQATNKTRH